MTDKEKIDKCIELLNRHINHCELEASGSLNNEKCHIAIHFDKHILSILKGECNE